MTIVGGASLFCFRRLRDSLNKVLGQLTERLHAKLAFKFAYSVFNFDTLCASVFSESKGKPRGKQVSKADSKLPKINFLSSPTDRIQFDSYK